MPFQTPGELEFQKHQAHHARRRLGKPHQIVDQNRRGAQQTDDPRAIGYPWIESRGFALLRVPSWIVPESYV